MTEQPQENTIFKLGPSPNGQILYFFGARHTNNPIDVQFINLRQIWGEFLNTATEEKIVFVEGHTREIPKNYEDSIREYGETGAIQCLARESDIEVVRTELNDEEQRKLLCDSFGPQIVVYALIAQNLAGWFRHTSKSSFGEAVDLVLDREAKFFGIYGFTPDRPWLESQHKKLFGEQQLEDKDFLDSISDPRKNNTSVNNVVTSRTKIRNEYLLSTITEAWQSGKSIFIVYGMGHLVALEPLLKKLSKFNS